MYACSNKYWSVSAEWEKEYLIALIGDPQQPITQLLVIIEEESATRGLHLPSIMLLCELLLFCFKSVISFCAVSVIVLRIHELKIMYCTVMPHSVTLFSAEGWAMFNGVGESLLKEIVTFYIGEKECDLVEVSQAARPNTPECYNPWGRPWPGLGFPNYSSPQEIFVVLLVGVVVCRAAVHTVLNPLTVTVLVICTITPKSIRPLDHDPSGSWH